MTANDYRKAEGLSRSELWVMSKTPFHFHYAQTHSEEKETEALRFGTAAHKFILEEEDFFDEYAIAPKLDRRTKEGKETWKALEETGKTVLTVDELEVLKEMKASIDAVPLARELLQGEHEQSFFWTDAETGIKCKIRPDCLTEKDGKFFCIDYKTTDSCADGHFERSVRKYGYKLQAGMYTEGLFQTTLEEWQFGFVVQEKAAPYAVRVYLCSPDFTAEGVDMFREYIGLVKQCESTGQWYGYEGPFGEPGELVGEE